VFYIHKISWAKWPRSAVPLARIPADAVTSDLRTRENRLSFWRCGGADEIEEAALAIAAAGEQIGRLDLVWIEEADGALRPESFSATPGKTAFSAWRSRRFDLLVGDYEGLGRVAEAVRDAVLAKQYRRFERSRVSRLLVRGIRSGIVRPEALSVRLRERMDAVLARDA